jgi:hypothetical protein
MKLIHAGHHEAAFCTRAAGYLTFGHLYLTRKAKAQWTAQNNEGLIASLLLGTETVWGGKRKCVISFIGRTIFKESDTFSYLSFM